MSVDQFVRTVLVTGPVADGDLVVFVGAVTALLPQPLLVKSGGAPGGGGGAWIPLVDGSEPPHFITDGAGHLLLVAYP